MAQQRRKSAAVGLGLTVLVAASLAGCSQDAERDTAGYCVDKQTQQRVDDEQCTRNGHGGHYGWYYARNGVRYPAVGQRARGGSFTAPTGSSYVEGGLGRGGGTVDAGSVSGGTSHTVSKGGFGGHGGKSGS